MPGGVAHSAAVAPSDSSGGQAGTANAWPVETATLIQESGGRKPASYKARGYFERTGCGRSVRVSMRWIKSQQADIIVGTLILLNAAFLGVEVDLATKTQTAFYEQTGQLRFPLASEFSIISVTARQSMFYIKHTFNVIFALELVMRTVCDGYRLFLQLWGFFDAFVVLSSLIDAWIMATQMTESSSGMNGIIILRLFRLVRICRMVRLMRMFPDLAILVTSLVESLQVVFWDFLLIFVVIYMGSIFCCMFLSAPDVSSAKYFNSMATSVISHFKVVTLEGWPDIADAAMEGSQWWFVYFALFIMITNMSLMNLVMGVIIDRVMQRCNSNRLVCLDRLGALEDLKRRLWVLFEESVTAAPDDLCPSRLSISEGGIGKPPELELSMEELEIFLLRKPVQEIIDALEISLDIPFCQLKDVMDLDKNGRFTFDELYFALLRLRGSASSLHSLLLQYDVSHSRMEIVERLDSLKQEIEKGKTHSCSGDCRVLPMPEKYLTAAMPQASPPRVPPPVLPPLPPATPELGHVVGVGGPPSLINSALEAALQSLSLGQQDLKDELRALREGLKTLSSPGFGSLSSLPCGGDVSEQSLHDCHGSSSRPGTNERHNSNNSVLAHVTLPSKKQQTASPVKMAPSTTAVSGNGDHICTPPGSAHLPPPLSSAREHVLQPPPPPPPPTIYVSSESAEMLLQGDVNAALHAAGCDKSLGWRLSCSSSPPFSTSMNREVGGLYNPSDSSTLMATLKIVEKEAQAPIKHLGNQHGPPNALAPGRPHALAQGGPHADEQLLT